QEFDEVGAFYVHRETLLFASGLSEQPMRAKDEHERHGYEQHDVGITGIEHRGDGDDLARDEATDHRAGERADAANDNHHKGLHQYGLAHVGRDRDDGCIDDAGEACGHGSDAENQHEDLVDVDSQRIDHHRVLYTGANDHADARAVQHEVEDQQSHRDDAEQGQPVSRVDHEAQIGDADQGRRRRNRLRQASEKEAHRLHKDDPEAKGHQELIFIRPRIEVTDDEPLH